MTAPDEHTIKKIGPIWLELWGGVWHVTRPDRFLSILDDEAILSDPPRSDYKGTFAQSIGGISLFDFRDFDPLSYDETHNASWKSFIPHLALWAGGVWLEVDNEKAEASFVSGIDLYKQWDKSEKKPNILPRLEAAHIGDLTLSHISRVIFIRDRDKGEFHEFECSSFDRAAYEALLPEWRDDYEFASLPFKEKLKRKPPDLSGVPHDPELADKMAAAKARVKKDREEGD